MKIQHALTVSPDQAAAILDQWNRKFPAARDWIKKLNTPMSAKARNELVYRVEAAERCLKVANFLGLSHVADLYERFAERGTADLVYDWAKTHPLRTRIDYSELARSLFPVQQMPEGAKVLYDREPGSGSKGMAATFAKAYGPASNGMTETFAKVYGPAEE
jgi:hypothetical protein